MAKSNFINDIFWNNFCLTLGHRNDAHCNLIYFCAVYYHFGHHNVGYVDCVARVDCGYVDYADYVVHVVHVVRVAHVVHVDCVDVDYVGCVDYVDENDDHDRLLIVYSDYSFFVVNFLHFLINKLVNEFS